MAATITRSVGWVKGIEEEDGRCRNKLRHASHEWNEYSPSHWDDKASASKGNQSDGFFDKELSRKGIAQRELCANYERIVHDEAFLRNNEEGTAFVDLLRTCAKSKDLYSGTKIHDDILEKGLLESCSNALVTMYAKCGALAKARELLDMHNCNNVSSWNALIAGYTRQGQGRNALHCFERMQHNGLSPNAITFACVLKACGSLKAIDKGNQIHDEIVRQGLLANDIVLGNALIDMYAKCGMLAKAQGVLEELPSRDVVSWNALITGYAQQGQGKQALNCFEEMQHENLSPDAVTFICVLKACGSLKAVDKGEKIHDEIVRQGLLENDIVLGTALVDMYAKCGVLEKAQLVLDKLSSRNVVSWNALITGYANQDQGQQALKCFELMQYEGLSPDAVTFACILKACGSTGATNKGEQIHDEIARQGLLRNNIVLGTALVDMYAKCGALEKAQRVLDDLPFRDVVSWNALIAGYAQKGPGEQALNCLERMQSEGLSPNTLTFTSILKACGSIGASDKGEEIHDEIARQGLLVNDIVLGTTLVDMYAKCGALAKAERVLEELPFRDVVSWSALITGYAQHGEAEQALTCFERMQRENVTPNAVTFSCVLKACGALGAIEKGAEIHDEVDRQGLLENNIVLGNALVDMYAKCGALDKAHRVLEKLPSRDVVSWTALIGGYAQQGKGEQALACFEQMQREGIPPNAVTFACTLKACGTIKAADKGKQIHDEIARQGLLGKVTMLGTALVDMYAMCGALEEAQRVLDELPYVDVVSWNALITGYAQEGQGEQALNCFERMQREGIPPNAMTYSCILKACSTLGNIHMGEKIHDDIDRQGLLLGSDIVLGTALVDMYAKCGALAKAQQVLEELPSRDVVSWNALITGYTQQGQGEQALHCFDCMQQEGIFPNTATFLCVLNVCCHLGLVEDGHMYFVNMSTKYGVTPDLEIYTCMIDLFGRAGHLQKAVKVIQEMPSSNYSAVWHTLLSSCQKWGDVNLGRWAFEKAIQVDQSDGVAYVLMANIYAAAGMQEKAKSIEAMGRENKASQVVV